MARDQATGGPRGEARAVVTVQLEPGQILGGRYEIGRLLGQGGMGSVYEVRHTGTRKRMALKVITADVTQHPGLVARFQVEARAAGAIESQHIAQVFDVGSDETLKVPYMAMEFLVGEDLEHLIYRVGVLPPELALRIIAQALVGLETAHAAAVVHRDLKPANIYVTKREGEEIVIKLLDFGIAKILQEQDAESSNPGLTRTGSLIGSPLYMSPEQARGRRGGIDQRTDLWSIGIVLYQILSGRTPHQDNDAMGDLIIAICSEPAASVQDFAPWVPPEIADILHKSLQIDVENRYQTAGEMLADIRALMPDGTALTKDMLGALDPEAKSVVAPKTSSKSGMTGLTGETPRKLTTGPGGLRTTGGIAAAAAPPAVQAAISGPGLTGASSTTDALATDTTPAKPSRTPLLVGATALAVVAGAAVAITLFVGSGKKPDATPAATTPVETAQPAQHAATPAATPAATLPAPTPSASSSAAPAASAEPQVTPQAPAPNTSVPIGYPTRPAPPKPSAASAATPAAAPPPPPPQPPPKKNPLDVDIK